MRRVLSDIRNLPLGQLNDAVTEPAISINRLKTIKQGLLLTALAQQLGIVLKKIIPKM